MSTPTTERRPIQLHYDAGQVVITPNDQDRFVMASQHAISACQNALATKRFIDQFRDDFLLRLHKWCANHNERVRACYVPFSTMAGCIKVFVVAASAKFDFELSDLIADLELELDRSKWQCDVLQIGAYDAAGLETFFDPQDSILVHGDGDNPTA